MEILGTEIGVAGRSEARKIGNRESLMRGSRIQGPFGGAIATPQAGRGGGGWAGNGPLSGSKRGMKIGDREISISVEFKNEVRLA